MYTGLMARRWMGRGEENRAKVTFMELLVAIIPTIKELLPCRDLPVPICQHLWLSKLPADAICHI